MPKTAPSSMPRIATERAGREWYTTKPAGRMKHCSRNRNQSLASAQSNVSVSTGLKKTRKPVITKRTAPVASNKKPTMTKSTVAKEATIRSSSKHMALGSSTAKTGPVRSEKNNLTAGCEAFETLETLFFEARDAPKEEDTGTREAREDETLTSDDSTRRSTDSTVDTTVWSEINKQAWNTVNDETSTVTNALTQFINFMLSL